MSERRLEGRFLCADLVKVEWLTHKLSGGPAANEEARVAMRTADAILEDISPHGACVQVDEAIRPGTPILISAKADASARLAGEVSYCAFRDYGYFIGIRFAEETIWSSGVYQPQHLTDLAELAARDAH